MKTKLKATLIIGIVFLYSSGLFAQGDYEYPFRNPHLPAEERIKDLISRLTLEEKVQLMKHTSPAIPRLGVPAYNWWNEALHGVARTSEKVTVFPQAIAMAATFDTEALETMADMTASEGRAMFNEDYKAGKTGEQYRGLTYWTPNINIFRDPRWGRGQETYGEDPYLTAEMGSAMVRGLEGNDSYFLKSVAAAKHFAVHSGPEYNRHSFDARPSTFDLWDTYLPAFRTLVTKAKVHGIMCAYNRLNNAPCCGHNELLNNILRNQWGFKGYVTSDCWGVSDFMAFHKTHASNIGAASDAMLAGTDLECGNLYQLLEQGVKQGLHSERDINVSLERVLSILFKIGLFDPIGHNPYSNIGREVIESDVHKAHAYDMAKKSMVLLKNKNNILPLNKSKVKRIAIIGPNADNEQTQLANYFGVPTKNITPYKSLVERFGSDIKIDYYQGTNIVDYIEDGISFKKIASNARKADVIIFVSGISADYEGEAGNAGADGYVGFASGDRTTMALPAVQTELMKELKKTRRPLVIVNMSGSVMSFEWESKNADAIIQAWYGGQSAGDAIVDVLFGDYNPAGRMPLTTYMSDDDLPPFEDYSMANRTYRYFKGDVRYPFGFGLSYTDFSYDPIQIKSDEVEVGKSFEVKTTVRNSGKRDGEEVVQLYIVHPQSDLQPVPISSLKGFKRIYLKSGESKEISFVLTPEELALTNSVGNVVQKEGNVDIYIGGGQPQYSNGNKIAISMKGDSYQIF